MQPSIQAGPSSSTATDHVATLLARRLATVQNTGLRESSPTEVFERLTRVATTLLHVPVALVTLVDADQQVLVSSRGLPAASAWPAPLAHSFSQDMVAAGEPLLIADVCAHPLVRDDPALTALSAMACLGCDVEVVETGQQAVEAVRQGPYDLVLMDCHMPALDGFAATEAIRRYEQEAGQGHHTPIVALTADALAGDVPKSLAAGMDDHLAKPVTLERLAAVVERWAPASGAGKPDVALDPSVIAALRERDQGQPGLLAQMVGLYLRDARAQLAALRQAAERGDGNALERAAHSLKGGSAPIGARAMVALCRDLETAAQAVDKSRAAALVATLERTFDQVRAALAALPEVAGPGPAAGTEA